MFDSRHSLNLFTINFALQLFEDLGKIMPVIIIVGNHDTYFNSNVEVNALKIFKEFSNIKVIDK